MHHMAAHNEIFGGLSYARLLTRIFKKWNENLNNELCIKINEFECVISTEVINSKMGVHFYNVVQTVAYLDGESA